MKFRIALALAIVGTAIFAQLPVQNTSKEQVGPAQGGGYLLNNGWTVSATGEQVSVDTFPMSSTLSSDGKYLLVLNGGIHPPTISIIDVAHKKEVGRTPLSDAWLGLTSAPNSNLVYVGGGSSGKVYELSIGPDGALTHTREFVVSTSKVPAAPFIGDVALSPDARVLYAADLYGDSIAQINLQSGKMVDHWKTGRRPYRIIVSPDGAHLLISSWAENVIYEHESGTGVLITKLRVGSHPTDMLWINKPFTKENNGTTYSGRLFVAASNSNSVYSFGVMPDGQLTMLDPINISMTPMHPLGMTPSGLATDSQGTRLYVTCSGANAVAATDISVSPSVVLGLIPTGQYPTALHFLPENQIAVLNGKGSGEPHAAGSVEFLSQSAAANLGPLTARAVRNSPYRDALIYGPIADAAEAYFSRTQEHPSPIQHVVYVIEGNQTYDEVLGDLGKGNGDKSLTQFGEQITPNLHKLAREFINYDDVYSNADNDAEGQNWDVAAIAPDYTVKLSPSFYGGRNRIFNFEGGELANTPPAGYLWSNALQAGLTVRNYGEWVRNASGGQSLADPSLASITDMNFRGPDPAYKDLDRATEFIREWKDFDAQSKTPNLSIVRLSNDSGEKGGPPSAAQVADNDRALGLLVDAVSHSKSWSATAIFVIGACATGGRDHVNEYRIPAWLISPYTRRGSVDSTMFNQTSVLRTIELILGMRPMTHFDAGARTMFESFTRRADAQPFDATVPKS
jgi:DNA-binding beta-propeller fold protein YncE